MACMLTKSRASNRALSLRVALSCGACLVGPTRKTMQNSEDLQLETYILFGKLTTYLTRNLLLAIWDLQY